MQTLPAGEVRGEMDKDSLPSAGHSEQNGEEIPAWPEKRADIFIILPKGEKSKDKGTPARQGYPCSVGSSVYLRRYLFLVAMPPRICRSALFSSKISFT